MNFNKTVVLLVAGSAFFAGLRHSQAGEPSRGFFSRILEMPLFGNNEQEFEDYSRAMSEEQTELFEIEKLDEDTDNSFDEVEERIMIALDNGYQPGRNRFPSFAPGNQPSLDELRDHLISRGFDPSRIDQRVDRAAESSRFQRSRANSRRLLGGNLRAGNDPLAPPAGVPGSGPMFTSQSSTAPAPNAPSAAAMQDSQVQAASFAANPTESRVIYGIWEGDENGQLIEIGDVLPFDEKIVILPIENMMPDQNSDVIELGDAIPYGAEWPELGSSTKPIKDGTIIPIRIESVNDPDDGFRTDSSPTATNASQTGNQSPTSNDAVQEFAPQPSTQSRFQRAGVGFRGGFSRGRVRSR